MASDGTAPGARPGALRRLADSDLFWSFRRSPVTVAAAAATLLLVLGAVLAPLLAPHNPYDLASLDLLQARDPPAWEEGGDWSYPLGTDDQGRDVLSAILYGLRLSLFVGGAAVLLAAILGLGLGLLAGYAGGWVDAVIMRIADVQLSFPAILVALLVDGVARSLLPHDRQDETAVYVVILAIASSIWVQFARTVRGSTLVERSKEYVQAARIIGVHPVMIAWRHVLPNALGPVLVIATINLAIAILTEATLSFLGRRHAGDPALARHTHPHRRQFHLLRRMALDPALSRHRAGQPDARRQPAWRLAARRAQPEAPLMAESLLEVEHLRIEIPTRRGVLTAIDDVSFTIGPGEVLGVVGESGAGKSLTGAAIIGLLEPPSRIAGGRIIFAGKRIDDLSDAAMRPLRGKEIGAIFQDPLTSLNPLYTVGRQLVETIRVHLDLDRAAARRRALALLQEVGIPARRAAHRPLSRTSSPAACASAS